MRQWHCPQCGAEIGVRLITPDIDWMINEEGILERNDCQPRFDDIPWYEFYCMEDGEHLNHIPYEDMGEGWDEWCYQVEEACRDYLDLHMRI